MNRERERHRDDSHRVQESALRDRYAAIAAQLAHDSAAIRQAGVYALTALADDWHVFGEQSVPEPFLGRIGAGVVRWGLWSPISVVSGMRWTCCPMFCGLSMPTLRRCGSRRTISSTGP
ncbi:hypothetical protein [Nocardia wallacei]|uniref:hypothetical protein n=1 Tax=Nocardia wallacei TaxID=480035 RepID=UPI002454196E|nr:hypothetical protein [Nocardia wallacei]